MKVYWFAALIAAIAALQCSLILTGVLPVLSAYSFGHAVFTAVMFGVLGYMGWLLYKPKTSMKRILCYGALIMLVAVVILCLAVLVGFNSGKPVLGVVLPAAIYVVPVLAIYAAVNAVLGAFFAGCGALARKIKHKKKR